jgi:DNA-binding CsgD family transcriptional regulator
MTAVGTSGAVYGRESDIATVGAFVDELRTGPTALILEGAAGIGKTTLWRTALHEASTRRYAVLSCRAAESESGLAFVALGDLFGELSGDDLTALPAPQRRAIEVALLRTDTGTDVDVDSRAVSLAALSVVRKMATSRPTLLAVDDVQWLDAASAAVLTFVARRLGDTPVGLAVTRRSGHGADPPLGLGSTSTNLSVKSVSVGPLDRVALSRLLRERLDLSLPPPAVNQIHRVTGGNPLFALEMARALVRRGVSVVQGEAFPVPENLRQLVRERIAQLGSRARDVVLIASAVSQPTATLIRAAADAADEGVGEAVRAGVLEVHGERVVVSHPLLGSVWYSEQPAELRRELHRRLADVVLDPDDRVRHLALAATGPDASVAEELDAAAVRAHRCGSPEIAAQLSRQAVELTPSADMVGRWQRALSAAGYTLTTGDAAAAAADLEKLIAAAPDDARRTRARRMLGGLLIPQGQWERAGALLRDVLTRAKDADTVAGCESALAWVTWFQGDLHQAVRHIRAAAELVDDLDRPSQAELLGYQAFLEGMYGERRTDSVMAKALGCEDRTEQARLLDSPVRWSIPLMLWDDRLDDAARICADEYRHAISTGDEHVLPNMLHGMAEVALFAGRWEEATAHAAEQHRTAEQTDQQFVRSMALYLWSYADAFLGRDESAIAKATEGLALADEMRWLQPAVSCRHVLGFVALSREDFRGAHEQLGVAVQRAAHAGLGEPGVLRFVPDDVEALVAMGEIDQAETTLAPFAERSAALNRRWAVAAAARGRGLISAARGEHEPALGAFVEAVELSEHGSQPFEHGRSLLALGVQLRRMKKRGEARSTLDRAAELFDSLGAAHWARRTASELGRISGRRAGTPALTASEEAVAQLVAEGRTNREIAAATFMSLRTVESHLTHVYRKLGIRSRTELAQVWSARVKAAVSPDSP